ncbi:PP2C family protein-serine/threonine phosphatase [Viridibacterium curvum]|uniref:Protein phosphatase 2C domain-containing protein n=1 Tax=Viridibacterium curvum TaxID=1101404 RepID=A0ABP9QP91_9RHOO
MLAIDSAEQSNTGGRTRNEDFCGSWQNAQVACWCLSDGAGGHGSGDVASRLVVRYVLESFAAQPVVSAERIVELLEGAHAALMDAKSVEGADNMHATCSILLINRTESLVSWGHVGDSRIYLFRNGQLAFQTRDHSLVQTMIDAGYGDTAMIRTHPQRSLLTSAIGNSGELQVSVSGAPAPLAVGDVFLMCTDGWWEYVEEGLMQSALSESVNLQDWLTRMATVVMQTAEKGHDNFTGVAIAVRDDEDSPTTVMLPPGA